MQADTTHNPVNIIVWAESREKSIELINRLIPESQENKGFYTKAVEDQNIVINCYGRWPKSVPTASPHGITDILVAHLTDEESVFQTDLKTYKNARKGIPYKYLTSGADLADWSKENGFEFIKLSEVNFDNTKRTFIRQSVKLDNTLREVFNKIDINGNGFIDKNEILGLSKELGHELNEQDAFEITNTLADKDGKVHFNNFKEWWVMGRTDFATFRRLVEMEMSISSLIKKSSSVYHSYLEELNKESASVTSLSSQMNTSGRTNILPIQEFTPGIGFSLHMTIGKEFDSILENLPDYFLTSPLTYVFELKIKDADKGGVICETLENTKNMLSQMFPMFTTIMNMGLAIEFRHVGHSIYIDISYDGLLADKVNTMYEGMDFTKFNYSGNTNNHFYTGVKLTDFLNLNLSDLIDRLTKYKIEGFTEMIALKEMTEMAKNLVVNSIDTLPNQDQLAWIKPLLGCLELFSAIRTFKLDYRYDSEAFKNTIIKILNTIYEQPQEVIEAGTISNDLQACLFLTQYQEMANSQITAFAPMAGMFLGPYMDIIKELNFDFISIVSTIPKMRVYYQINVNLAGLAELVDKFVLNN